MTTHQLTRDQARRIAVSAQLFDARRPGDVVEVAEQLGAIKIDPTSVIAPAEHTMLWSRVGFSYEPYQLTKAAERDRHLFELDGAYRPMSLLPLMLPGMRHFPRRESNREWLRVNDRFAREILARLKAEGPLLASDIADTAVVGLPDADGWYSSNQVPRMLEFLSLKGEVAVSGREGRRRRWDLAERVYPSNMPQYSDEEAAHLLDERRLKAAGIAKQRSPWTPVGDAGEPAVIEGMKQKYRVDPDAVAALDRDDGGRVAFLSPYDGMLFDRPRLREIFEFDYVLEQFKPKADRKYGAFAHPILMGDRFVGLLQAEVDRKQGVLNVVAVHEFLPLEAEEKEMIDLEIAELAQWLDVELSEPR